MLDALKNSLNHTQTENGAVVYETTQSHCLDLFATIGALRHSEKPELIQRFQRAYIEDPDLAMKLLFFARDVRGGLGERGVFRTLLRDLAAHRSPSVEKNINAISEMGRWDDLLTLLGTPCQQAALDHIKTQWDADLLALAQGGDVSLLAKWLPSINASSHKTVAQAKIVAEGLNLGYGDYRKKLSKLRKHLNLLENHLREVDYSFDYSKQPSKAMMKYRQAFFRHDEERYEAFLNQVSKGEATLHTGTLAPYEIVQPFFNDSISPQEANALDVTWRAQEDFTRGENALVVIDGSGSMYCEGNPLPAHVALSLGIYYAQHNQGVFHNHFITFSERPQLVEIKGDSIWEQLAYCESFDEVANTDLKKVFDLILSAAVSHNVPPSELPSKLYIISDMEFDCCVDGGQQTHFARAKAAFARHGYQLPHVVFWNVQSRNRHQPVTQNEQGVTLVSGCTPRIFSMVQEDALSPYAYMMEVLGAERYKDIVA